MSNDRRGLLLRVREYATLSRVEARLIFHQRPELAQAWGLLYCESAEGERWTLLGDHQWVAALIDRDEPVSAEIIASMPQSVTGLGPADPGALERVLEDSRWQDELFHAQWLISGWPRDWGGMGGFYICRWGSREAVQAVRGW